MICRDILVLCLAQLYSNLVNLSTDALLNTQKLKSTKCSFGADCRLCFSNSVFIFNLLCLNQKQQLTRMTDYQNAKKLKCFSTSPSRSLVSWSKKKRKHVFLLKVSSIFMLWLKVKRSKFKSAGAFQRQTVFHSYTKTNCLYHS